MDATLADAVARLRLVPREARTYEQSEREAAAFGLGAGTLQVLNDEGLTAQDAGGRLYSASDLHFLGLRLGSPFYLRSWQAMARSFSTLQAAEQTELSVQYVGWPGEGKAPAIARSPDGSRVEVEAVSGKPAHEVRTVVRRRSSVPLPPELRDVGDEIAGYDLYPLPPSLKDDLDFVRRTGICDCFASARLLVETATARGLAARPSWGLLLTLPFSSPHAWAELLVGGAWEAYDPLLLSTLTRFGGLDEAQWPATRNITTMVERFDASQCSFLEERAGPAEYETTTFITTIVDGVQSGQR